MFLSFDLIKKYAAPICIIAYVFFIVINSFYQGPYFDAFYYWSWGQHLALGYLDGPPLVAYFMRFFDLLFGNSLFTINFYGVFTILISAFFVFKMGALLADNKEIGLGAALLWLISNNTQAGLLARISYDNLEELFWIASTYFALEYLKLKCNRSLYLAGVCLGLLLLSKYSGLILAFAFITFFIFTPSQYGIFKNKHFYFAALIAFLIFYPNLIWNFNNEWMTFTFQQHAHPMSAKTHWLSMVDFLLATIKHHIYAIPVIIFLVVKHPHEKVNSQCWRLFWHVFLTLLFIWLIVSYSATVYHGYLLLLNVPIMILLSYYLIKFQYQKTLWLIIALYGLSSLFQIISFDIRSQSHIYELNLLKEFKSRYLLDKPKQAIVAGGDYVFLAKVLFVNPTQLVSSIPPCDGQTNQFRYWNSNFQQDLIARKVPQVFYIDVVNKPGCIKPYFKSCTQLPTLIYKTPNKKSGKKMLSYSLYIYKCKN